MDNSLQLFPFYQCQISPSVAFANRFLYRQQGRDVAIRSAFHDVTSSYEGVVARQLLQSLIDFIVCITMLHRLATSHVCSALPYS
ncbi:hypothetical protein CEXT_304691 [Caerostris extrusa]|uniref:Uncharacterized protein n=1 Tax=Caerostris extrusa TaxID=172846 RepID=A0AAV4RZ81_CAEEX|nr:hypothetical protein CEXT_304691 [Caerostris extrusa]